MKYEKEFDNIIKEYDYHNQIHGLNGLIFKGSMTYLFLMTKLKLLKYTMQNSGCGEELDDGILCGDTPMYYIKHCPTYQSLDKQIDEVLK